MKFEENEVETPLGVRHRGFVSRKNRKHSMKVVPNEMERLLGVKERINKRVTKVKKTIKQFKKDLDRCNRKLDGTSSGPTQEAIKDQAKKFIKEKRWYQGQLDMLQNQALKLDRVIFASESIKDAQETVSDLIELDGMMKNLQDDMMGLINGSNEILESLGRSHSIPDKDIDEKDLNDELKIAADEAWYPYGRRGIY